MAKKYSIIFAGGGTAGHVNPLLATAHEFQKRNPDAELTVIGTSYGLETDLVPAAGFPLRLIPRVPFPRRPNLQALLFLPNFVKAVKSCKAILSETSADAVVGFGGYVSTPMYLAAKQMKLPLIVHEGNARPGLANKLGARWAKYLGLTFPSTKLAARNGRTEVIGMPLRSQITAQAASIKDVQVRNAAIQKFGLNPERLTILVTGGSSGAVHLNREVAKAAKSLISAGAQVIHLTGKGKSAEVQELLGDADIPEYRVLEYLAGMQDAYAAADLVIARSGAGMVAEIGVLGLPAIFVPLPIGNGEQALNAADVVASGGAKLINDADFSAEWICRELIQILDRNKLHEMGELARGLMPADAATRLAQVIEEVIG
ncbi:MAG: undecaprenyldiphospho-muramoylpentapeptide beta-N-acetylglucosaminyltransferase [Arcanobacterium sp.]|nr:undecaprenyldiphospho-muramoylpentapeptide beta-N-acetylglucosaminyltransferase [Arcanobacterium sp.]